MPQRAVGRDGEYFEPTILAGSNSRYRAWEAEAATKARRRRPASIRPDLPDVVESSIG